jgi:hypothetical protein
VANKFESDQGKVSWQKVYFLADGKTADWGVGNDAPDASKRALARRVAADSTLLYGKAAQQRQSAFSCVHHFHGLW